MSESNDPIDNEIRSLMANVAHASPTAPEFDELFQRAAAVNAASATGAVTSTTSVNGATGAVASPAGEPVMLGTEDQLPVVDELAPADRAGSADRQRLSVPWWQRLLAGVGIAGIAAGGAYGVASINSGDDGGADTPIEAATAFMTAIDNEDVIGAAEVLEPSERKIALDYLPKYLDELQRMGLVSDSADLRDVSGGNADADPTDLEFRESVIDEDRVRVTVTGLSVSVDPNSLPLSDRVFRDWDAESRADTAQSIAADGVIESVPLVAVERDGDWFVSLAYTGAEYALDQVDWDRDAGEPITPNGADSPEGAARNLVDAVLSGNTAKIAATMDPAEGAVIYDYLPIVLANGRMGRTFDIQEVRIDDMTFDVSGGGNNRTVSLKGFDVTVPGVWDETGDDQRVILDDGCLSFPGIEANIDFIADDTRDGEQYRDALRDGICADADAEPYADVDGNRDLNYARYFSDTLSASEIEVAKTDGAWYVAPMSTIAELALDTMGSYPDNVLDADLDEFQQSGGLVNTFFPFGLLFFAVGDSFEGEVGVTSAIDDPTNETMVFNDFEGSDVTGETWPFEGFEGSATTVTAGEEFIETEETLIGDLVETEATVVGGSDLDTPTTTGPATTTG